MAFDIYSMVTDRIIAELEKGHIPWKKPWRVTGSKVTSITGANKVAFNRLTKLAYSGLNQMLLSKTGEYASFKQWHEIGGVIKKGAKAEYVVFWKWLEHEVKDGETGDIKVCRIPVLKYYNVFHIDDVDSVLPLTAASFEETDEQPFDSEQEAEKIIATYSKREDIPIIYRGNEAYYAPTLDRIVIPERHKFKQSAEFYSTVFHEITHSTGAEKRLNRINENGKAFFGNEAYSKEELVAEIGASGMLSLLNIETPASFTNSTAYIESWLRALRNDKRLIVSAASRAEKAIDYIINGQRDVASEIQKISHRRTIKWQQQYLKKAKHWNL